MDRRTALFVLGLKEDATLDEIKRAYRAKAKVMHPDKGGKESDFIKLADAYRFLTGRDKIQRQNSQTSSGKEWVWCGYDVHINTTIAS